jgi:hypothetical protein
MEALSHFFIDGKSFYLGSIRYIKIFCEGPIKVAHSKNNIELCDAPTLGCPHN